jgi:ribonuclease P protein component
MAGENLPRTCRLKTNAAFRAVIDRRVRYSDRLLTMFVAANGQSTSRLGVSTGRAVGGAVWRNRVKRLIREAWRRKRADMPTGYDFVVMMTAKKRQSMPTHKQVDGSLGNLLNEFSARCHRSD